jgi:hypothetical protein
MILKSFLLVSIFIPFILSAGCSVSYQAKPGETPKFLKNAFSDYESKAFGPDKSYAVVSIIADPTIRKTQGGSSLSGMIKAASDESGYWSKSESIFKETTPVIVQEFQRSSSFKLVPEQWVIGDPHYQSLEPEKAKLHFSEALVANNYKYIDGNEKLAELAKALNVDGVIVITVHYGFAPTGANFNGLLSVGSQVAVTSMTALAVDQEGNTVWKASETAYSDKLTDQSSVGESVNFKKLHPHLVVTTRDATQKLLGELEKKISVAAQ